MELLVAVPKSVQLMSPIKLKKKRVVSEERPAVVLRVPRDFSAS